MGDLSSKVAVITGGTNGIGLATAHRFVADGAKVVVTGRRQDKLNEAVAQIGKNVDGLQADGASLADAKRLHDFVKERHGRLDVLFASAGAAGFKPFGHVTEEEFDQIIDANIKGTFFTVQELLPLMPDGASIILNTSLVTSLGWPAFSVYSASKAAVRSFARTWTTDLKDRKIRVNALSPGNIETGIGHAAGLSDEQVEAYWADMRTRTPLGRNGVPEDIAAAASYLASSDSAFVSGIELTIDGGLGQV